MLLYIIIIIVSTYIIKKYSYFVKLYYDMYKNGKEIYLERFLQKQQIVNLLNGTFQLISLMAWVWVLISAIVCILTGENTAFLSFTSPIILITLFITYIVMCWMMNKKYKIFYFCEEVKKAQSMMEVVDEDNDHEVTYVNSCKELRSFLYNTIIYIAILILYVICY